MSGVGITIQSDDLEKLIGSTKALETELTSSDLLLVAGRAVQQTLTSHFFDLSRDSIHHRTAETLGANRTNFYEEAAQAVQQPIIEGSDSVMVSVDGPAGLAQRYFGGTIEGKPYLAIPALAEVYGKNARDVFDELQLKMIIFPSGAGAIIKKGEKFVDHETEVYYWLVRSVTQAADPSVLPTEEELLDPALLAVQEQIGFALTRKAA